MHTTYGNNKFQCSRERKKETTHTHSHLRDWLGRRRFFFRFSVFFVTRSQQSRPKFTLATESARAKFCALSPAFALSRRVLPQNMTCSYSFFFCTRARAKVWVFVLFYVYLFLCLLLCFLAVGVRESNLGAVTMAKIDHIATHFHAHTHTCELRTGWCFEGWELCANVSMRL